MEDNNEDLKLKTFTTCSSTLSEQELLCMESEQYQEENIIQLESVENNHLKSVKRVRDEEETEWTEVRGKDKKSKGEIDKIEIYISYSEQLPKQFALAKLLKENNISDVQRVKYISAYKVRLDMQNELSADRLEHCKMFIDKGWRIQRAMEKNLSYGVIRDVDLDMSDNEIFNNISCPKPAVLLSTFRLNRRSAQEGWARSESVRLCFKGDFLPAYIYVDGLRIKVDPFVFPVSQCSRCWRLGHTAKRCPSSKVVCPKCGENHSNCETRSFKCVNCSGRHMAIYKGCPAFIKEKKLRDIMADFNCTYRKALMMYVAPNSPVPETTQFIVCDPQDTATVTSPKIAEHTQNSFCKPATYSEVTKTTAIIHQEEQQPSKHTTRLSNKQMRRTEAELFDWDTPPNTDPQEKTKQKVSDEQKSEKVINFSELLNRLKNIIFLRGVSMQSKVKNFLKCCVEWLILVVVYNVIDWPILKKLLDLFIINNG